MLSVRVVGCKLNTTSEWGIKAVRGLYGAVGTLVELGVIGQDQPIQEVRNYLSAKFDARFELDPFVLEDESRITN